MVFYYLTMNKMYTISILYPEVLRCTSVNFVFATIKLIKISQKGIHTLLQTVENYDVCNSERSKGWAEGHCTPTRL